MTEHALGAANAAPLPASATLACSQPLHDGKERPFTPRLLGRGEFKKRDVFRFFSPKEWRIVDLIGPFQLGYRLQLEFAPNATAVVERPRKLQVSDRLIELTFWWREPSGKEHFVLLVPDVDTIPGPDKHRRPRQMERLLASAAAAGIDLALVTEEQVQQKRARTELYYQLLGFVQSAKNLKSDLVLRHEVLAVASQFARVTVQQLESDLARYPRPHIYIVIAELIYLGVLATDATSRLLRSSLVWRVAP